LRPAVKKLYQLRPKVYASRVSVASGVVKARYDELRPAVSKEVYQLHRKILMYKMSKNWKVLTQFYCTFTLYTIICTHTELLNDSDNTVVMSCYCLKFKPYLKKNLFGEDDRHIMFLIPPISSYCYDMIKALSPERVLMQ